MEDNKVNQLGNLIKHQLVIMALHHKYIPNSCSARRVGLRQPTRHLRFYQAWYFRRDRRHSRPRHAVRPRSMNLDVSFSATFQEVMLETICFEE